MRKLSSILAILFIIITVSCTRTANQIEELDLKDIDRKFSEYSVKHGVNAAFIKYADEEGVILKENSMPIEGIKNIRELYKGDDSNIQLSWEPSFAAVAISGELGYTYGTFDLWNKATNKHSYGTYVSIWRRNSIGQWRFVLDTGNQGLVPPEKID